MKKFVLTVIVMSIRFIGYSQEWKTSGTYIYNNNTGNVGIGTGTTAPGDKLTVVGNISLPLLNSIGYGQSDRFTYDGKSIGNYTLGWYNDSGNTGAPSSYYSGYGGIKFFTQAAPRMVISSNGNIGINNTSPNFLIDMITTTTYQGIQLFQSNGKWVRFYSSSLLGGSFNNITSNNDAGIVFGNIAGINTVDQGFVIVPHRGDRSGLRITPAGNVAIGVNDTNGYRFAVGGKMIAEEVNVKLQANWPDYVFEKNYDLPSLEKLNEFITKNKHLPEMPAACSIEENGINLGEMNVLLLKKVEELTLYVIELQRQNVVMNDLIKKMQNTK
ncbi:MAG TPA: hypothetical protein VIM65_07285 [Cyclobacteriaceae bacterium]